MPQSNFTAELQPAAAVDAPTSHSNSSLDISPSHSQQSAHRTECNNDRKDLDGATHTTRSGEDSTEHWESGSSLSESDDEVSNVVHWHQLMLFL